MSPPNRDLPSPRAASPSQPRPDRTQPADLPVVSLRIVVPDSEPPPDNRARPTPFALTKSRRPHPPPGDGAPLDHPHRFLLHRCRRRLRRRDRALVWMTIHHVRAPRLDSAADGYLLFVVLAVWGDGIRQPRQCAAARSEDFRAITDPAAPPADFSKRWTMVQSMEEPGRCAVIRYPTHRAATN